MLKNCHTSPFHKSRFALHVSRLFAFIFFIFLVTINTTAQRPCNDTVVRISDTICEGDSILYFGRILDHAGLFFDTIPRTDTLCDSIIILKLNVLDRPYNSIGFRKHCKPIVAYDLLGGYPQITFYQWSANPPDSTLIGQEHLSWVRVNPRQPTTYNLILDYREEPELCRANCSITVNPIETVVAAMHVTPDEITFDNMHIIAEDHSTGTREAHWGGWAGRNWYINGVRQQPNGEWVEFYGDPTWGDTVHLMMEAYTPTCLDTATRDIPFRQVALYIPNIFTPSAPTNNILLPHAIGLLDFEMWIYDRRGSLMFHTTQISNGWDGTSTKGLVCPTGVYTYYCRYKDVITPLGNKSTTGTITLIR